MQASKNYELFCKRKINLHCHTLIFFMFIGSFTQTCLGLLEAFSWYPCFFRTYPATRQRILKISLSQVFSWCNLAISKSRYLENHAVSNFLSGPFRVRDSGTRLYFWNKWAIIHQCFFNLYDRTFKYAITKAGNE